MAVLEGRVLVEHYVSRRQDDATSIDGNIYLGKVQNVLPGMEAAFIDIGTPKNGVLYRGDVTFDESEIEEAPAEDRAPAEERPGRARAGHEEPDRRQGRPPDPRGQPRRPLRGDGAGPAGRPTASRSGCPTTSASRLRKVLEGIRPADAGLIVRTAAEGATPDELARDLARLQDQWQQISSARARGKPAKLLYQEPALVVRVIREEFTKEYRVVVIDDQPSTRR